MSGRRYLLVPSLEEGNGTGHLRRILRIFHKIKEKYSVKIVADYGALTDTFQELLRDVPENDLLVPSEVMKADWDFIVTDLRSTESSLFQELRPRGILIGIDEGGSLREGFDFLIDIIPSLSGIHRANLTEPGFMELPEIREFPGRNALQAFSPEHGYITDKDDKNSLKVLISFGGEDAAGLSEKLVASLQEWGLFSEAIITVVKNIPGDIWENQPGITHVRQIPDLGYKLDAYDLVFTSFGLTAFEALASGVPFMLLNPGEYHRRLSEECGFFEIGTGIPERNKIEAFFSEPPDFSFLQKKYISGNKDLSEFLLDIEKNGRRCPVCGREYSSRDIPFRFETRNFYRCRSCSIIYQKRYTVKSGGYHREYFFDDYKKQYGRTYLEDFSNIRNISESRLDVVSSLISASGKDHSVLDAGCAYGPFLAAARDRGYIPFGVELIPEAADYVAEKLGIPVITCSFEDADIINRYSVVSMWYVIEHFDDPGYVIKKVNKILETNGIFAFSTPNSRGISGRKNLTKFLENSPEDHITVWNPKNAVKIMKRYGFRVEKIRITGHHSERFFLAGKTGNRLIRTLLLLISKAAGLGDTFEVYARKVKDIDE